MKESLSSLLIENLSQKKDKILEYILEDQEANLKREKVKSISITDLIILNKEEEV